MVNSLSVFFPAYNEEGNIQKTVDHAVSVLKELPLKWEIIIVDDGSKDRTGEIADQLSKKNPLVRVVHQKNGGYGKALRTGFAESKYEWVTFNDSDGQFDFSEIHKFLENSDEADLILGYRIKRSDPWIRLVVAFGWKMVIFMFFGKWFKDIDCAFKMIKQEVLQSILPLESSRGGMISPELVLKAQKKGYKIKQIGVHHYPRLYGNPTGANIEVIIQSFIDLFKLRLKL